MKCAVFITESGLFILCEDGKALLWEKKVSPNKKLTSKFVKNLRLFSHESKTWTFAETWAMDRLSREFEDRDLNSLGFHYGPWFGIRAQYFLDI